MWLEIFLFVVVLGLWLIVKEAPRNFPPGPWGLPLVGYMPFLTNHPARKCFQLAKKYGDVMGITVGSYRCVVLNSESAIRAALKEMAFSGRTLTPNSALRSEGKKKGILLGDGPEWHEQRRFVLRHLRDFGFGKQPMEELIQHEVTELVSRFRNVLNRPVELSQSFNVAVLNSLWAMVAGKRMAHDDPKILQLVNFLTQGFRNNPICGPQKYMPWLVKYFPRLVNRSAIVRSNEELAPFLKLIIDQHRSTYDPNNVRDLVDIYLKEINACTDPASSFHPPDSELTLRTVLLDLFVAGTETTSTTLRWILVYLLQNPEVQKKVQAEIDRVVGQSCMPSLKDRPNLPYTEATIMEVQRIASMLPFAIAHATIEDTVFRGYRIPKGTVIFPNLYAVLHDPRHWQEPEQFRPERFLLPDGMVKRDPHHIPFSSGKRICLGETLARNSLFLFFTTLMQNFTFDAVPGRDKPNLDDSYNGTVSIPMPFEVIISDRFVN